MNHARVTVLSWENFSSASRSPTDAADLEAWLWRILGTTHPLRIGSALRRAEEAALRLHEPAVVARAIQRANETILAYR